MENQSRMLKLNESRWPTLKLKEKKEKRNKEEKKKYGKKEIMSK